MLRLLGSLRGLRVQLLLWAVLPLTLVLVGIAILGISTHQRSMRQMVEELNARSARLAAAHLSDELAGRVALLRFIAAEKGLFIDPESLPSLMVQFDNGLAYVDASGQLAVALPSEAAWQARPVSPLLDQISTQAASLTQPLYSPLFDDPVSEQASLLISLPTDEGGLIVGAVSLQQLKLEEIIAQIETDEEHTGRYFSEAADEPSPLAFLVDAEGQIIYHPDPTLIGKNLKEHAGVQAVSQGQSGATYHRNPDGQELVVGYAPVAGPGWGLIVQEPWEALIAPLMRISLLAPLAVVVAALISGLAVSFGLYYVVRPLQALDRQATRLAWGSFSAVNEPIGGIQEIEDLRRTLAGMAEQVQRYQSGMRDYIGAVTTAQEEERKRLARELHDETVQSLIALGHQIELVQKALDKNPDRARQRLADLAQLVTDTQQEVRRFSQALRPLYLEDLGFVPALEMLAQEIEREHGLSVSVEIEGLVRRLAPDLELAAYRIVQEGMSNVVRHAQARTVDLSVDFAADELILRIQDDGRGFSPPVNPAELAHEGHFGLMGLHERALLFGGRLEVRSKPGQGTTLEVCLPLPEVSIEKISPELQS